MGIINDKLELTFNVQGVDHVMIKQLKVLVSKPVFHVTLAASEEVVCHGHLMALYHQPVSQVGPHKPCPTGYLNEQTHQILPHHTVYLLSTFVVIIMSITLHFVKDTGSS